VRLWRSVDGTRWETNDSPTFRTPANVHGLAQLPNGDLLAIGSASVEEPAATGPRAAMWRSREGSTWQPVPLPALFSQAVFGSIAVQGTAVIVSGLQSNQGVLWRSGDAGESWAVVGLASGRYDMLETVGRRFVAFTFPYFPQVPAIPFATSSDGLAWSEGVAPSPLDDGQMFRPSQIARTASGLFLVGTQMFSLSGRLDWCYVAAARCQRSDGKEVVLHTITGDAWSAIDLEPLLGERLGTLAFVDTPAGTIAASGTGRGVTTVRVRTGSWRVIAPTPIPPLPTLPPVVGDDGAIEPGRVYRYPHSVWCNFEWLGRLNGRRWKMTRLQVGTLDTRWTLPQVQETLLGTIRLTAADTIEYSVAGIGVVAIYRPTTETPPGCL
jgi:hypothetical protein